MTVDAGTIRIVPTAEAARLLRRLLKATFPGQRFQVRSDSHSRVIDIEWVDGPCQDHVYAVARPIIGYRLEGGTITDGNILVGAADRRITSWIAPDGTVKPEGPWNTDGDGETVLFNVWRIYTNRETTTHFHRALDQHFISAYDGSAVCAAHPNRPAFASGEGFWAVQMVGGEPRTLYGCRRWCLAELLENSVNAADVGLPPSNTRAPWADEEPTQDE